MKTPQTYLAQIQKELLKNLLKTMQIYYLIFTFPKKMLNFLYII